MNSVDLCPQRGQVSVEISSVMPVSVASISLQQSCHSIKSLSAHCLRASLNHVTDHNSAAQSRRPAAQPANSAFNPARPELETRRYASEKRNVWKLGVPAASGGCKKGDYPWRLKFNSCLLSCLL